MDANDTELLRHPTGSFSEFNLEFIWTPAVTTRLRASRLVRDNQMKRSQLQIEGGRYGEPLSSLILRARR